MYPLLLVHIRRKKEKRKGGRNQESKGGKEGKAGEGREKENSIRESDSVDK